MKTTFTPAGTACRKTTAWRFGADWAARLLLGLLLFTLPALVRAQFNYTTENGQITITGYTGPGGPVEIPSTINGLPVTTIGLGAFNDKTTLASVTIPDRVTSIGSAAFSRCTNLTNVTIAHSVTKLGYGAFSGCASLTRVTIHSSVASIDSYAFAGCTHLTAIDVDALNPTYCSLDGVLFNKDLTALIQCPGGKAGSYTIPNSITRIRDGAFVGCTSLTNVIIPNSITVIGELAFGDCASLNSVTIPNNVTTIVGATFVGCTSLTGVTIPNSVTTIGENAFNECTSLTSVTIPNSVTSIGYGAFESCTVLSEVSFQGNAANVDGALFDGADQVTVYYLPGTTGWGGMFGRPEFADRPTALWSMPYPLILSGNPGFGVAANGFGFLISWATNAAVVVEASLNLATPVWTPVSTNTLAAGTSQFTDPQWANHPTRFYRLAAQ